MNFKNITKPAASKIIIVAGLIFIAVFCFAADSGNRPVQKSPVPADINLVKSHLTALTQTPEFRNHKNIDQLNAIADYIKQDFSKYGDSTTFQEYDVEGKIYKNVITSFGTEHQKRIIIGAHYDVCGDQQGADDNATGVTALLELARMLKDQKLNYRIDLVAYTLEEPPYFRTENMGSHIHAQYLKDNNIDVYGMASVEMIGYFKDEKDSQSYPLGVLSWVYGNKGDFITLVKKFGAGDFVNNFRTQFKEANQIKTETFTAPKFIKGTDFSDHLNYWKFGYSALMITDTSFFRNKNYHETTDTVETLDLPRMTKVIDGIFLSLIHMK
ncbi:Zn-dependent amino-or carboxypeptidase, M28 family [Chryseobacterium oleae]|uniref:Zn-dependent amino-or carboxypeptidase, M28 family n=1 Tax=Chryseobacterium oleae TaxID=491207 RepID=A0A1I5BE97_CHROL|nr:M28 family peptidase [Chryseobacterium oleae]SFN73012.1 Zn-dependent amino-or carboxypeptidase, M28 family [Chryseobacterium oleae]